MPTLDKRVDDYIAKAQPFAQPILLHLRALVHEVCPNVVETIKWGMPFFDYKGPMCHIAGFKKHCVMTFWKAALMKDPSLMQIANAEVAMGHLGKITALQDLPPDKKLKAYIKEAMQLNEAGIKTPVKPAAAVEVPAELLDALKKNKTAREHFNAFSNSHKKEYVQWIFSAKTEATRVKRLQESILLMAEGKHRNWKYEKK